MADNNYSVSCTDTQSNILVVTSYCNLGTSFSYTQASAGLVNFSSTSTGTVYPGVYWENWNYGDGGTGGGPNPSHTYVNGTYTISLTLSYTTTPNCPVTQTQVITVTSNSCNLVPGATHTVGASGLVNFNNTTAGTTTASTYFWNFGDGSTGTGVNPSHTYGSSGMYNVTYTVSNGGGCQTTGNFNVNANTAPCVANSNFSLNPSGTPQSWFAIPSYPWNVQSAMWSWGDGSFTPTLSPASHQYSVAGTYTICLTVTVSCGQTSQTCSSYFINKGGESMQMITVTVQLPGTVTDLSNLTGENIHSSVFPNPSNGTFQLDLNGLNEGTVKLSVYNTVGQVVYETNATATNGELSKSLNLNNLSSGVYFLKVNSGSASHTKKIVIK
jgi:PKD repeat protein